MGLPIRAVTVSAAALAWSVVAHAGETPLYQPTPAWVTPAPAPALDKPAADAPILLTFDKQQRLENGKVWGYSDVVTRIATGDVLTQAGTIQLPWQPDDGDLIIHRIEILRDAETIDLVKAGQRFTVLRREEQLEQLMLNGVLSATMTVEGLRVGDALRIAYSTTNTDRALAGQMQAVVAMPRAPARIGFGRARLSWPEATAIRWRNVAGTPAPEPVVKDGVATLELALPLPKAADMPADAPARFTKLPLLEASSFADWRAVSMTFAPLYKTDATIPPGSPLAEQVAKIRAAAKTPRERAAAALRLVQDEVRYLYRGMEGGNYLPQAPAQTWSSRYGDCKAKTLLLLALLRALDVEAEAVLASIGLGDHVPDRLPSAAAFDHVLVRATIDGKPMWLDGTGRGTRIADLDDVPPFGSVLPIRAAGSELVKLAPTAPGRARMEVAFDFDQRAGVQMPTLFEVTAVLRGAPAEQLYLGSTQATAEQKRGLAQAMVNEFVGEALIADPSFAYDAERAEATMKAKGLMTSQFQRVDERCRFALDQKIQKVNFQPDRARAAWRSIPVRSGEAMQMVMTSRLRLPDGGKGYALEGPVTLTEPLAGAEIRRTAKLEGDLVTAEDRIVMTGAEIAPEAVAATRAAVARAKTRPLRVVAPAEVPPRWQVAVSGNRKALAPLIAFYDQRVAEAEPQELSTVLVNRARFYAGIYDFPAALKDVARLAEVESNAANQRWLAEMLFTTGKPAEAVAAAEAALALDPADTATLDQLSDLYARTGRVDEALALLAEPIAGGGQQKAKLLAMRANVERLGGQADAAVASADAAVTVAGNDANAFNQRCWNAALLGRGLERAIQDCTRAIELGGSAAALDSRALVYLRMKRPDEALVDLNAALAVSPEMAASLYLRGIVRGQKGDKAGSAADLGAARLMAPAIEQDYAPFGIKP